MTRFGWCLDDKHDDCKVKYQTWYHGKKRVGRKMVDAIILNDTYKECDCDCHKDPEDIPVKKPARRRAPKRKSKA